LLSRIDYARALTSNGKKSNAELEEALAFTFAEKADKPTKNTGSQANKKADSKVPAADSPNTQNSKGDAFTSVSKDQQSSAPSIVGRKPIRLVIESVEKKISLLQGNSLEMANFIKRVDKYKAEQRRFVRSDLIKHNKETIKEASPTLRRKNLRKTVRFFFWAFYLAIKP
jgi:hypothetical protein